jgi:hypothetical protein
VNLHDYFRPLGNRADVRNRADAVEVGQTAFALARLAADARAAQFDARVMARNATILNGNTTKGAR